MRKERWTEQPAYDGFKTTLKRITIKKRHVLLPTGEEELRTARSEMTIDINRPCGGFRDLAFCEVITKYPDIFDAMSIVKWRMAEKKRLKNPLYRLWLKLHDTIGQWVSMYEDYRGIEPDLDACCGSNE